MMGALTKSDFSAITNAMAAGAKPLDLARQYNRTRSRIFQIWLQYRSPAQTLARHDALSGRPTVYSRNTSERFTLNCTGRTVTVRDYGNGVYWALNSADVPVFGPMGDDWEHHVSELRKHLAA